MPTQRNGLRGSGSGIWAGLSVKWRLIATGSLAGVLLTILLTWQGYLGMKDQAYEMNLDKSRSVALAAEITRSEMSDKWGTGIITPELLRGWYERDEMNKVMAAVPMMADWNTSIAEEHRDEYRFRFPRIQPRNKDNHPDVLEKAALERMKADGLDEYMVVDDDRNTLHYFRPILMSRDCLFCHGDPSQSLALWGNDQGLDPSGSLMEGNHEGEMYGAVEVIQSLDKSDARMQAAVWRILIGAVILGLISIGLFAWVVTRSVVQPVEDVIQDLSRNADLVDSSSAAVSSLSADQAQSASEQSVRLCDVTRSLSGLTELSQQTIDMADDVMQTARKAEQAAGDGVSAMKEMSKAIEEIRLASDQTATIVGSIDEIAFQTNLLALNAAVEAARAGDAGRGFAVVADEVRNLAQRSAGAARHTSELIEQSRSSSRRGVEVARDVMEGLQKISTHIDNLSQISARAGEMRKRQVDGITQISGAVYDMDQLTQGNAAGAQQSAAAARELSSQAIVMSELVSMLRNMVAGGGEHRDVVSPSLVEDVSPVNTDVYCSAVVGEEPPGSSTAHSGSAIRNVERVINLDDGDFNDATDMCYSIKDRIEV